MPGDEAVGRAFLWEERGTSRQIRSQSRCNDAACLPGQGHRALHNLLQSLVQSMMKLEGISSQAEAVNFLIRRIGEPHIT
eukprot:CAMPEP_0201930008 /NCGR_PEP_ID=MMETSP0903-20130614/24248_1 /ASSEMBLY_ACC=CAM_ASM_000552 /TAXON_ID=420261 /ORGANISM="Thalassiosira antarctica, Strain CCMP982" /LENGTH=79 /DNA_ID=CAMNT_0048468955 /DNA_START=718 /DNA_END=954 /DNA_ORIENTATION=-